jgi:hypothetical protein
MSTLPDGAWITHIDHTIGRAFAIVPKEEAPEGYVDLEHDDYQEGDFLKGWQEIVVATAESIVNL